MMEPSAAIAIDSDLLSRQLEELAAFSETPPPGVTRVLFSDADLAARGYVRALCTEIGLAVRGDAVGNLFARWNGTDPSLPPLATGSHIDAVPQGGRYDGPVGVLGALEAVRALRVAGFQPRRSVEIIVFTSEEPNRFGLGCLGSRLLSGNLLPDGAADLRDPEGRDLDTLRAKAGCVGDLAGVRVAPGAYAGFVELHIEQGPILEREGIAIGVVEKIAAPAALRLALTGEGGHAGAVLMRDRHDALLAGAEIALAIERSVRESGSEDTVGTVGIFRVSPGAINAVPGVVEMEIDLRDTDLARREVARAAIGRAIEEVCARRGVQFRLETINADPPAVCAPELVAAVRAAARELNLSERPMISRAYHDASFMALLCPVAMIFIPCRNGWSHRPDEYAAPEHIAAGVATLAAALSRLAA